MGSNPPPRHRSSSPDSDRLEFETSLAQLDESLQSLKDRYRQVQTDRAAQATLRQRLAILQDEITAVQEQLTELETRLESRLFNWKSQQDFFWQVIRFVGLGLVLGYFLRACTG